MQRVAELVEQRARIVEREQRRLAVAALVEVHDIDDQRADVACELLLVAQRRHPGAAALGRAREVIAEEQPEVAAVRAAHLPHAARRDARAAMSLRGSNESPNSL